MDVNKILRCGYFDSIKITGKLKPIYDSNGIDITSGDTFKKSVGESAEAFKNGLAQLKVYVLGESTDDEPSNMLDYMRADRAAAGLRCIETVNGIDKYVIAYMNILIFKGDNAMTYGIEEKGKTAKAFEKVAKTSDMLDLMLSASQLSKHIQTNCTYTEDFINIAIIDKVYVLPIFRRSGISTWLHQNMADIINMFALVWPTGMVMSYGDFANESEINFKMSRDSYNKMLLTHYKKLGYDTIKKITQSTDICCTNILYKLLV